MGKNDLKKEYYCVDTHPLVWYFTGQKTLSKKAKQLLDEIFAGKKSCFISSIVMLELFHLSLKRKKFEFPKILQALRHRNIIIVPTDQVVLNEAFQLPKNLEIHDRVILATAIVTNSLLVTKDRVLASTFKSKIIW